MTGYPPAYLFSVHGEATRDSPNHRAYRLFEAGLGQLVSCLDGSSRDHLRVADFLNVENSVRYRPDEQTYCNVYAVDFCQILGAYLPRIWWNSTEDLTRTHEVSSNGLARWLRVFGHDFGWRRVSDIEAARSSAAAGRPTIAIANSKKTGAHGHVAVLIHDNENDLTYLSYAGDYNEKFGKFVSFWDSDRYSTVQYWTNGSKRLRLNLPSPPNILLKVLGTYAIALDLALFISMANSKSTPLNDNFISALVYAEDRRFFRHSGFDVIGIARAAFKIATRSGIQGASTIEQQLVRTITNRRNFSIYRKITEIALASFACSNFSKKALAELYLTIAYYGFGMNGLAQAAQKLKISIPHAKRDEIALLVASLRYPTSSTSNVRTSQLRLRRARWIEAGSGGANGASK